MLAFGGGVRTNARALDPVIEAAGEAQQEHALKRCSSRFAIDSRLEEQSSHVSELLSHHLPITPVLLKTLEKVKKQKLLRCKYFDDYVG